MKRLNATSVMERLDVSSRDAAPVVKRGALPKPLRDNGGCCNYWLEQDINNYLQRLADERDGQHREHTNRRQHDYRNADIGTETACQGTGRGRWLAKCPAHDNRKASLAIRQLDDGRILLHDFAGCHVEHVFCQP